MKKLKALLNQGFVTRKSTSIYSKRMGLGGVTQKYPENQPISKEQLN